MLTVAGAEAAVIVTFVHPERYRDRDFRSEEKRNRVTAELSRYLEKLDRRYLKAGQRLKVEILDVRLAGRYEPWNTGWADVRVLRDSTPPRFKLRYTLSSGKRVIAHGEETVANPNYLWSPAARASGEPLAHEKNMLRDWFRKRFGRLRASDS